MFRAGVCRTANVRATPLEKLAKGGSDMLGQAAKSWDQAEESLFDRYNRDFRCVVADQPDLLRQAYETRYQVYCVENSFENPDEHSDGRETDLLDAVSAHSVLMTSGTDEVIGTVRLVLPHPRLPFSFSMQRIVDHFGQGSPVPSSSTAEVSRFSISKARRSVGNTVKLHAPRAPALGRAEPLMSLGLIQGLVRMSRMHGITHWCAVMEPKLLRMLGAMGIHFQPVGPLLEYHGLRQLCYCRVATILESVRRERPTFWEIITDGGVLAATS